MQASLAEVELLSPISDWENAERNVYVIAGCRRLSVPAPLGGLMAYCAIHGLKSCPPQSSGAQRVLNSQFN
jgi:hypothetical protein